MVYHIVLSHSGEMAPKGCLDAYLSVVVSLCVVHMCVIDVPSLSVN